ncbi:amino acid permease-associated protein [Halogeometricum pallidum JCM 14848]|uniref:Amino acid permease-associated protein n=1 Tax=Halogeometricum pallidum JCM 14848 TaxID=1227487 RepID=M0D5Y7_HALPD|nr:APC family permease [Halogeometricum pallidum]ELZ30885.1 amino acid permease-associated protein [Halogeometricum pallidum JCM 14848]
MSDQPTGTNIEGDAPVVETVVETDEATVTDDAELERTLGLIGGLAIGIGTMIGAGIFVFPGLAGAEVGTAATVSFAVSGVVALLVALPTSELATAMPKSGGGYYFISRGLGTLAGTVVGLSLWLGLVFATAFYLVGLGFYALDALALVGVSVGASPGVIVSALAVLFGIGFTVLNVTGTENAAKLQNGIVALLLSMLVAFLAFGMFDVLGVIGTKPSGGTEADQWAALPILSTAALVFTSYLGFAQVATVAGEMKRPGRNLPVAMIGSVVIVTVMYVLTIFVATSVFDRNQLGQFGETAMVEIGRELLGVGGAFVIVGGGLLATMSSANASILSTSRAIYGVSKDALLPRWASRINLRYGTPHVALGMAGGPIIVLAATREVQLLAEVASFLHLIMYGLICVALVAIRRDEPEWYDPAFRVPGGPAIPVVGAVSSFGLIAFMDPRSIAVGAVVILATAGWYLYYARDVKLRGVL